MQIDSNHVLDFFRHHPGLVGVSLKAIADDFKKMFCLETWRKCPICGEEMEQVSKHVSYFSTVRLECGPCGLKLDGNDSEYEELDEQKAYDSAMRLRAKMLNKEAANASR